VPGALGVLRSFTSITPEFAATRKQKTRLLAGFFIFSGNDNQRSNPRSALDNNTFDVGYGAIHGAQSRGFYP